MMIADDANCICAHRIGVQLDQSYRQATIREYRSSRVGGAPDARLSNFYVMFRPNSEHRHPVAVVPRGEFALLSNDY